MLVKSLVFLKHLVERAYFALRPARYFTFNGKRYRYFYAFYNATWTAERKIEIPVFLDVLRSSRGEILEVGNVLQHYAKIRHDVVDKYENGKNVINQDVVDFNPNKKYDLIMSISTLEHVGWDEPIKDSLKVGKAINNLMKLLKPDGILMFSYPADYNPNLDNAVRKLKNYRKWEIEVNSEGLTRWPKKKLCIVKIKK